MHRLHPFLIGQPHRIKYLEEILAYIMGHDGVWQTTADEIAEYYIANYYDAGGGGREADESVGGRLGGYGHPSMESGPWIPASAGMTGGGGLLRLDSFLAIARGLCENNA